MIIFTIDEIARRLCSKRRVDGALDARIKASPFRDAHRYVERRLRRIVDVSAAA